jgi:two-component system cell cycle response regulator DivK
LLVNKKIMLVEDDFINMRLAQHVLESEGYVVLKAATAQEALEQMESVLPDLILVDVQLPDIDGLILVRMLREKPKTRDAKIMALTACAMKGDRERMLKVGCDGYISKPIDVKEFIATVRGVLNAGKRTKRNKEDSGS